MGSCGSLFLGYMLATIPLVVAFMQEESRWPAVAMPILILSVPIYDTLSVILIRLWNKRSPFAPDHNHLFHRLLRLGISVKKVTLIVYLLSFAVGLSAMLLFRAREWEAFLIIVHILAMYGVFIIIETTSVRLRDREQLVRFRGSCFIPGRETDPTPIHGTIRMLTANSTEMEVSQTNLTTFATAMAKNQKISLQITEDLPELEQFTILCQIRSVWQIDGGKVFIGLNFLYSDEWEYRTIKANVAALIYPARKGGEEEKAIKDSNRFSLR